MTSIGIRTISLLGFALTLATGLEVGAADYIVLGKRLLVKNPTGLEKNRTVIVLGKEAPTDLPTFDNGPPITASLRVILNGTATATPSDVTYTLGPPGVWTQTGPGDSGLLKYTGGDPVKLVFLKFNPGNNPSFIMKAKLKGSAGPASLDVVPPNGGTTGGIIVTLDQGVGDNRFCVSFGGAAGGTPIANYLEQWKIINATGQPGCPTVIAPPESNSQSVGANGSVTTDTEADGAEGTDPLETTVTTPNAGTVQIQEDTSTDPDPSGYHLVGQRVDVTAPSASAENPLVLVFLVDSSVIPAGQDPADLQVFRDGALVEACVAQQGVAFPDPCVAAREAVGDDQQITVLSTHASRWTFGLPLCGNGALNGGEACDPPGVQAQCGGGLVCKSNCQCAPTCDCCALNAGTFDFTTGSPSGNCGTLTDNNGMVTNLACSSAYWGGGGNTFPLPIIMPDQIRFKMAVSGCDSATEKVALSAAPPALSGSLRTCTAPGCEFGAPVAIPNPTSTPVSTCMMLTVAQDASGTTSCDGDATIAMPLLAELFLTGDSSVDPGGTIAGIQSCPLCSAGTCIGGPNNGMACTAGNSALNSGYPTSRDCPPNPILNIGTVPIGATFTSGTTAAVGTPTGPEVHKQRIFCGFCRDSDNTGGFQNPPQPCDFDADCVQPYESCEQKNQGAFGPAGGLAKTISLTGTPSTCLADGGSHPSTLVGGTCIAPTFDAVVDNSADLPGPAALSFQGGAQLAAPPPPCTCGSPVPSTLTFNNTIGSGICGSALTTSGSTFTNLACGGLYFGGGGQTFPLPATTLDSSSVMQVTSCTGTTLTLGAASALVSGSNRTCTKAGCLFGPPVPIPNGSNTPTSICILNSIAQDASGIASCATGVTNLNLTVSQTQYLDGDLLGSEPGIQPCPLCLSGTCQGGPNNGMACTAESTDLGAAYPTSNDCPPPAANLIGSVPFPYALTTGVLSWTGTVATNDTGVEFNQPRVFCGYCRNVDSTFAFENPAKLCWNNGMAVGTACAQPNETCEQRNQGAFGPNGGAVLTISASGTPAGSLIDHAPHATTLMSLFCAQPTFNSLVDTSLDLPGPGAVTLEGTIQVQ